MVAAAAIDARAIHRLRLRVVDAIGAEHTLDAADDAADSAAHDRAHRTGAPAPFIDAVLNAAGNALRLRGKRRGQCDEQGARNQNRKFHLRNPWLSKEKSHRLGPKCGDMAAIEWQRYVRFRRCEAVTAARR